MLQAARKWAKLAFILFVFKLEEGKKKGSNEELREERKCDIKKIKRRTRG